MNTQTNPKALECWVGNLFHMRVVPYFIVSRFEQWRTVVEASLLRGNIPTLEEITGWGDDALKTFIETAQEEITQLRRVLCSANELPDGTLLLGARHWDDMMHTQMNTYLAANQIQREEVVLEGVKQGFVDQWGNFLTREAAWLVAEARGQIRFKGPGFSGPDLYSENLW